MAVIDKKRRMKTVMGIHNTAGHLFGSELTFLSQKDCGSYHLQSFEDGPLTRFFIDDDNEERGFVIAELPNALLFYPDRQGHPHVLFAVFEEDGCKADYTLPVSGQVLISIVLLGVKAEQKLMCPGCGSPGPFQVNVEGFGTVDGNNRVISFDNGAIAAQPRYRCPHCLMKGDAPLFSLSAWQSVHPREKRRSLKAFWGLKKEYPLMSLR